MKDYNGLIQLMQENPEGFSGAPSYMAEAEAAGICYEVDGWYFLHDEYLDA